MKQTSSMLTGLIAVLVLAMTTLGGTAETQGKGQEKKAKVELPAHARGLEFIHSTGGEARRADME